jgi:DNA (cytosine-5)-methyltransferase 1
MNYLSVCSGVEAATVAWHHMGWNPVGFGEIEKFPSQVLAYHYPNVTNFGDMTKYKEWDINDTVGLLVGGTPCQSFSVAGLRKGMDDPRGNLAIVYCGILNHYRPKWFIWENVPGVLSSNRGRDFGSFLGAVAELGYGFAYRVLDAQYWGVAQRRKRVFVVGYFGDWRPAGAVLFEPKSVSRDTAPSRIEGQEVTRNAQVRSGSGKPVIPTLMANAGTKLWLGNQEAFSGDYHILQARGAFGKDVADTVTAKFAKGAELLQQGAQNGGNCVLQPIPINDQATRFGGQNNGNGNGLGIGKPGDPMPTLDTSSRHSVAFGWQNSPSQGMSLNTISPTLDKSKTPATLQSMTVRRLTPIECERLQGFPDNYTNIKENCPDGPRYKALGNSMAVPVMKWIGKRINEVENERI